MSRRFGLTWVRGSVRHGVATFGRRCPHRQRSMFRMRSNIHLSLICAAGLIASEATAQTKPEAWPKGVHALLDIAQTTRKSGDFATATTAFALARAESLRRLKEAPDFDSDAYSALVMSRWFADTLRGEQRRDDARALYEQLLDDFRQFQSLVPRSMPYDIPMQLRIVESEIQKLKNIEPRRPAEPSCAGAPEGR